MNEILHIYGQTSWHDNAYISGDREALTRLRNLIDFALKSGVEGMNFFCNDGEGFTTYVYCLPSHIMDTMSTPYTADYARDSRNSYPWNVDLNNIKPV